jgi:predicted alpha/beta hydrolase family esterase
VRHAFLVASPTSNVPTCRPSWPTLPPRRRAAAVPGQRPAATTRIAASSARSTGRRLAGRIVGCGYGRHVNADAGFGDWPEGHARLMSVLDGEPHAG